VEAVKYSKGQRLWLDGDGVLYDSKEALTRDSINDEVVCEVMVKQVFKVVETPKELREIN
jgi:hypothetical protein